MGVRSTIALGPRVLVSEQSTIDAANDVPIAFGEGSTFGPHLHVFGYAPIDIGTDCMFSSNVYVESGAGHDLEVDGVSRRPAPLQTASPKFALPEKSSLRQGSPGLISCDERLFETLRTLRKQMADERDVPAYIILSDVSLRQIARHYPTTESELMQISGVGEKKLRDFGAVLIETVDTFLKSNPKQTFAEEWKAATGR